MANVDRPNGFTPVKTVDGQPLMAMIRTLGVASGADIFKGDPVKLSSGLVTKASSSNTILGVAVGFGRISSSGSFGVAHGFDPSNLEKTFYDDSADTNTEWVCYYVPASNVLFEVQTDSALSLVVGSNADFNATAGSSTTGNSKTELTTDSAHDVIVVEDSTYPDNDTTLANARHMVKFVSAAY